MRDLSENLKTLAIQYVGFLRKKFKGNLQAAVLFGSVARGEARETSDIDLLLIFKELPPGRMKRRKFLGDYPAEIEMALNQWHEQGLWNDFVEHLKTVEEIQKNRTPFLCEVVKDGIALWDGEGIFAQLRSQIEARMKALGSQWKRLGRFRYLDLKPDLKPGEVFEL
ncbi:MAG TPA: hypothetical protein DF383_00865 [Deltaproteobacteria bacterium]|nr:hypothetical protein [Deltaproteobacteria bacterium]